MREQVAELYEGVTGECAPQPVVGAALDAAQWNNKGVSLVNLGRPEEALACSDQALTLHPQYAQAWFNKGGALGQLGRWEEALVCFAKAQQLGLPQAAEAIALIRQRLGR